jgi:Rod binding domain-containing protein
LVHAAQQLVSQTFFGQMLKQMRDDPFKSKLFDGGRGGQMFSAMYDQKLADRMARGAGNKLVMSVVRHIEKGAGQHTSKSIFPPAKQTAGRLDSAYGKSGGADSKKSNSFKNVRIHVPADLRA